MGCFSSKEESVRLENGSEKRSLTLANSRHELIISGLESNKFLPLVRKPKKISSRKRARILRSNDVPLAAAVLRTLNNDVKGGGGGADTSPAKIITSSLQRVLLDDTDDKSYEEFSFDIKRPEESKAEITGKIESVPTKDLKSVRVMSSSPNQELLGQEVSMYSPSTYVTPRFGSYGLPTL